MPGYGVGRDIPVFKAGAGGTEEWQTVIDTGGDDTVTITVQTAGGGYALLLNRHRIFLRSPAQAPRPGNVNINTSPVGTGTRV